MKKLVLSILALSFLAFACTDNPFFKIALNIPYNGSYTITTSKQVGDQLIFTSDEDSYADFISTVNEKLSSHGVEGDFSANLIFLELTIPDESEIDWSALGEVSIEFVVDGEENSSLDEISFPATTGKTLKVGLPEEGISINDFLAYKSASIKITANISQDLVEDIPLALSAEVAVSTTDEK